NLYLSVVKDYYNGEILSFSTSNNNDIELILDSYKDLSPQKGRILNTYQGAVYFAYKYIDLARSLVF
ncbi:MAG: hypothetical protein RR703_03785, partial [Bacilli bacterium]